MFSVMSHLDRAVLLAFALLVASLLACTRGPDPAVQAGVQQEVACRKSAESWCRDRAANASDGEFDRDQCISKRAWDCEMGQTPEDMKQRYQVGVESPAPPEEQMRNPDAALGNSYEGIRMQDEAPGAE